ncbi:MAG: hypothetical protein PHO32_00570 [Candidatus Cloacimonetes bacterium]|nr:hypothetical protein [Candidatus Cloacimonadota bacterium]
MKAKNKDFELCSISQIYTTCDQDGGGILGFTNHKMDGSFNNVMRTFSAENHTMVMAEIMHEHEVQQNKQHN